MYKTLFDWKIHCLTKYNRKKKRNFKEKVANKRLIA